MVCNYRGYFSKAGVTIQAVTPEMLATIGEQIYLLKIDIKEKQQSENIISPGKLTQFWQQDCSDLCS